VDASRVGITGHSLGGKLAILAAAQDARFGAVLAVDPVDDSMNCSATNCPSVATLLPSLQVPVGYLGETLDGAGGFQPCAPAAHNYAVLYGQTPAPSFAVTVNGAGHMSFLDDPSTCGFTCSFCATPTADHGQVIGLTYAYEAAFFERHLRGLTGYDAALTGAQAQARYVAPGLASLQSK
jgi:pimeloyl-ACP methyl ester carboxylesterase